MWISKRRRRRKKKNLNPNLKVEHYPLPRLDDIIVSLSNGKVYSMLDLLEVYMQLKVNLKSRHFLTENTHLGLFRKTCLCYGVAVALATFRSVMDEILKGIHGAGCYLDVILIAAANQTEAEDKIIRSPQKDESAPCKSQTEPVFIFQGVSQVLGSHH
jgi:hypothetical protein